MKTRTIKKRHNRSIRTVRRKLARLRGEHDLFSNAFVASIRARMLARGLELMGAIQTIRRRMGLYTRRRIVLASCDIGPEQGGCFEDEPCIQMVGSGSEGSTTFTTSKDPQIGSDEPTEEEQQIASTEHRSRRAGARAEERRLRRYDRE